MKFYPYARPEGSGFVGPFGSRQEAERFLEHCRKLGREQARIAAHSSMVMTSDNSPVVVNVAAADLEGFAPLRIQQEANGSWSIYEGEAYRRGAFRTRDLAQGWLDGWTEAGAEFA